MMLMQVNKAYNDIIVYAITQAVLIESWFAIIATIQLR